jgi:hypothetical protein
MGFVTVLVQHAWAMQPAGAIDPAKIPDKPVETDFKFETKDDVRISVPSSVTAFAKGYNATTTAEERRKNEIKAFDLLQRLEHMALACRISDPFRFNKQKAANAKSNDRVKDELRNTQKENAKANPIVASKTRRYAAQARRSLLALSRVRSKEIRRKSLHILIDAYVYF